MFCHNCGAEIKDNAAVCVRCGCVINKNGSSKDWLTTLLLCFFVGYLGVHRFYAGKIGTGILQLVTGGGCGIWVLIDFIMICTGSFTDGEGRSIKNRS
jgi:hypothetical protein